MNGLFATEILVTIIASVFPTTQSYDDNQNMLPGTLTNALDKFRKSDKLRKYLGDGIVDTFADVKQAEYDDRSSVLSPWDVQYLMVNI